MQTVNAYSQSKLSMQALKLLCASTRLISACAQNDEIDVIVNRLCGQTCAGASWESFDDPIVGEQCEWRTCWKYLRAALLQEEN
jgi:hypothetical protein